MSSVTSSETFFKHSLAQSSVVSSWTSDGYRLDYGCRGNHFCLLTIVVDSALVCLCMVPGSCATQRELPSLLQDHTYINR